MYRIRIVAIVLTVGVAMLSFTVSSLAQKAGNQAKHARKAVGRAVKRFTVEGSINLNLIECKGSIDIPALNFKGDTIEIKDNLVTLTSADGTRLNGKVIAYARSAYYLDANVGLSFTQTSAPVTSSDWKPPVTISLLLIQNRKHLKELSLLSVPSTTTIAAPALLRCTDISATRGAVE